MSVEVQWTETDPESGAKRFVAVERFARGWTFRVRDRRREPWTEVPPTPAMWAELLDALERRLPRKEGVTEADVAFVRGKVRRTESGGVEPRSGGSR